MVIGNAGKRGIEKTFELVVKLQGLISELTQGNIVANDVSGVLEFLGLMNGITPILLFLSLHTAVAPL